MENLNSFIKNLDFLDFFLCLILIFKFCLNKFRFVSGCFDTSGSMIPLSIPEISPWVVFVTRRRAAAAEEEFGILAVGLGGIYV